MTLDLDRRRRRRGPQVRQDRAPAAWINRAKRTLRPARSTPPRGASRPRFLRPTGPPRGHPPAGTGGQAGNEVLRLPAQRSDQGLTQGTDQGSGCPDQGRPRLGPAGLRSLPAKQHAPKVRPTTHHREWPAGVVPGRPSSTNGLPAWTCAAAGCRTFALDRRASLPCLRHERPGDPCGQYAGGRSPPGTPLLAPAC
jgi:hypothetical protein